MTRASIASNPSANYGPLNGIARHRVNTELLDGGWTPRPGNAAGAGSHPFVPAPRAVTSFVLPMSGMVGVNRPYLVGHGGVLGGALLCNSSRAGRVPSSMTIVSGADPPVDHHHAVASAGDVPIRSQRAFHFGL